MGTAQAAGPVQAKVDALVTAEMDRTGKPRHEAFRQVMKQNPQLRQELISEVNGK